MWPWLGSLAVFLVWVTGGILFKPGFYDQVVMREFLGRFSRTVHQPQPVYFYLPHLLLYRFMPWSALMILLAIVCRTRGRVREALRSMPADIFWADLLESWRPHCDVIGSIEKSGSHLSRGPTFVSAPWCAGGSGPYGAGNPRKGLPMKWSRSAFRVFVHDRV